MLSGSDERAGWSQPRRGMRSSSRLGHTARISLRTIFQTHSTPAARRIFVAVPVCQAASSWCSRQGSVVGFEQAAAPFSPGGGYGTGRLEGCAIFSLGQGFGFTTQSSQTITSVSMQTEPSNTIPASVWHAGDGIIVTPFAGGSYSDYVKPTACRGSTLVLASLAPPLTLAPNFGTLPTRYMFYPQAVAPFVQVSGQNFNAGDTIQVGNHTYTFVNPIGATPGNVLTSSSNWSSDFANLMNCINNHTTNSTCVAPSTTPDVTAHVFTQNGYQMAYFQSIATAAGSGYPSVYTSTYGPSFGPGKFIYGTTFAGDGTAYQTHAVIEQLPVSQKFTVNTYIYPQTNTTSSTYVSSTGILTLHFASAPIDTSGAVGLPITVDGYSGPNAGLNGTCGRSPASCGPPV